MSERLQTTWSLSHRIFFGVCTIVGAASSIFFLWLLNYRGDRLSEWQIWNMVVCLVVVVPFLFLIAPPSLLGYYPNVMFSYISRESLEIWDRSLERHFGSVMERSPLCRTIEKLA